MSDSTVQLQQDSGGDRLIDAESLVVGANTVQRQRVQLAGAAASELAVVTNGLVQADDYALATRGAPNARRADKLIFRHLTDDGSTSGVRNAAVNHSAAAQQYWYSPGAGNKAVIERMLVYVEDVGAFDAGKYGNNITLANGIELQVRDGATDKLLDLVDDSPVKTNGGWAAHCYDADVKAWGTGNEIMVVRWTFARCGKAIELQDDDRITVILQDDFSNLVDHRFVVQGYLID